MAFVRSFLQPPKSNQIMSTCVILVETAGILQREVGKDRGKDIGRERGSWDSMHEIANALQRQTDKWIFIPLSASSSPPFHSELKG